MARGYEYYLTGNLIALIFIPLLIIFFVFRENAADFGFGVGESKRVWWIVGIFFAAMFVILIPASRMGGFQNSYPIFRLFHPFGDSISFPENNMMALFYGWASYGLYMFGWEFFFRGYLLFGLEKTIGWFAIILQAVPFMLLHVGKPTPEIIAAFPAGIILGIIALRARSFLPCFVLHWAVSISFDILVLVRR